MKNAWTSFHSEKGCENPRPYYRRVDNSITKGLRMEIVKSRRLPANTGRRLSPDRECIQEKDLNKYVPDCVL